MKRTLTLQRETLTELTSDDLMAVVGGDALSGPSCPVAACTDLISRQIQTCRCATGNC